LANIDRADWHYGGNYPSDLPPENGSTHIGMYIAWAMLRNLASDELRQHAGDTYEWVLSREVTGRDLLITKLDEKFFDELLTPLLDTGHRPHVLANRLLRTRLLVIRHWANPPLKT
jgi:hypothetical protein